MSELLDFFKKFENDDSSLDDFIAFSDFYKNHNEALVPVLQKTPNPSLHQELLALYTYPSVVNTKHALTTSLSDYLENYQQASTCLITHFYKIFKDPFDLNTLEIVLAIILISIVHVINIYYVNNAY